MGLGVDRMGRGLALRCGPRARWPCARNPARVGRERHAPGLRRRRERVAARTDPGSGVGLALLAHAGRARHATQAKKTRPRVPRTARGERGAPMRGELREFAPVVLTLEAEAE